MHAFIQRIRAWARSLKREAYVLYLAMRDPRTPWFAKALAFFVVAHTFSPIDLIPDFIPILGYLDDLIITPLGLWLVLRMIPANVIADARLHASANPQRVDAMGRLGAVIVVTLWLVFVALIAIALLRANFGGIGNINLR